MGAAHQFKSILDRLECNAILGIVYVLEERQGIACNSYLSSFSYILVLLM